MIAFALAMLSAVAPITGPSHEVAIQHRGAAYNISYRPVIATQMRTVGISSGARMSTERCRWSTTIKVERQIRGEKGGEALGKLLPASHKVKGSRHSSCDQARAAIEAELATSHATVAAHVQRIAQADRSAVLADIDAARALAMN